MYQKRQKPLPFVHCTIKPSKVLTKQGKGEGVEQLSIIHPPFTHSQEHHSLPDEVSSNLPENPPNVWGVFFSKQAGDPLSLGACPLVIFLTPPLVTLFI